MRYARSFAADVLVPWGCKREPLESEITRYLVTTCRSVAQFAKTSSRSFFSFSFIVWPSWRLRRPVFRIVPGTFIWFTTSCSIP